MNADAMRHPGAAVHFVLKQAAHVGHVRIGRSFGKKKHRPRLEQTAAPNQIPRHQCDEHDFFFVNRAPVARMHELGHERKNRNVPRINRHHAVAIIEARNRRKHAKQKQRDTVASRAQTPRMFLQIRRFPEFFRRFDDFRAKPDITHRRLKLFGPLACPRLVQRQNLARPFRTPQKTKRTRNLNIRMRQPRPRYNRRRVIQKRLKRLPRRLDRHVAQTRPRKPIHRIVAQQAFEKPIRIVVAAAAVVQNPQIDETAAQIRTLLQDRFVERRRARMIALVHHGFGKRRHNQHVVASQRIGAFQIGLRIIERLAVEVKNAAHKVKFGAIGRLRNIAVERRLARAARRRSHPDGRQKRHVKPAAQRRRLGLYPPQFRIIRPRLVVLPGRDRHGQQIEQNFFRMPGIALRRAQLNQIIDPFADFAAAYSLADIRKNFLKLCVLHTTLHVLCTTMRANRRNL